MQYTNFMYYYDDLHLMQQQVLKGTSRDYDESVLYTCLPLVGGATVRMHTGMRNFEGQVYGPGTFLNLKEISDLGGIRKIQVLDDGVVCCLDSPKNRNIHMVYTSGNSYILPPDTAAIVMSGSVSFKDNNVVKQAEQFNMIKRRPYSIDLNGQAELVLVTK